MTLTLPRTLPVYKKESVKYLGILRLVSQTVKLTRNHAPFPTPADGINETNTCRQEVKLQDSRTAYIGLNDAIAAY